MKASITDTNTDRFYFIIIILICAFYTVLFGDVSVSISY